MKRLLTVIVLVVALVSVSAAGSVAGVKKIRPDELKSLRPDLAYNIYPTFVSSASATRVIFHAVVKIPLGKVVKKLTYYHRGGNLAHTRVDLNRHLMGENFSENMTGVDSQDATSNVITVENTSIIFAKIKSGYTYFIEVQSYNNASQIEGIKITYK